MVFVGDLPGLRKGIATTDVSIINDRLSTPGDTSGGELFPADTA